MAEANLNFREKSIEILKQARKEDDAQNFSAALELYQNGIQHLMIAIKWEKTESIKKTLKQKAEDYIARAEAIRDYLNSKGMEADVPPITGEGGKKISKKRKDLTPYDEQLRDSLQNTIMTEKPNVKWSDIAGLTEAKAALREAVILPLKAPHLFESRLEAWKGILLYGPPGTGKTMLGKAVATECSSTFYFVSSADLVSKYVGESERYVKQLFQMAKETIPSIIFIDEIDSLCSTRKESDNDSSTRIKTEFLQQMQGVASPKDGILVIGATNLPWQLDGAVLRRFQRRIYIPLPDESARDVAFDIHLKNVPHSISKEQFEWLANQTQGYSQSDIKVIVQDAKFEATRLLRNANYFQKVMVGDGKFRLIPIENRSGDCIEATFEQLDLNNQLHLIDLPPISFEDCKKALKRSKTSIKTEDLEMCNRWTQQYGFEGS